MPLRVRRGAAITVPLRVLANLTAESGRVEDGCRAVLEVAESEARIVPARSRRLCSVAEGTWISSASTAQYIRAFVGKRLKEELTHGQINTHSAKSILELLGF